MPTQVWSLVSLGVGLNLVLGALVAAFKLPIYLDSLGTVLVAALAGAGPACLAGGCGVALLGLTNPVALAFLPVGVMVGLLSGGAARLGAFHSAWRAGTWGASVGIVGAALSAPISAYMFGGVTGGGTDVMVALFRASGLSIVAAAFGQGLSVDPLDKMATFLLVFALLRALPRRATAAFPLCEHLPPPPTGSWRYRPQRETSSPTAPQIATWVEPATRPRYPQSATAWKLFALVSLLSLAILTTEPRSLSLALLMLWTADLVAAPRLTMTASRRMLFFLAPLALSLTAIHGVIAHVPGETRVVALGLSWSCQGLLAAWLFLARVSLMVLAVSFFLATTPLLRMAELLQRFRVPYPLVFVLLTGANLGNRLRERWHIVEEVQQARGLVIRPGGMVARARVLLGLLTPTLGAVFSDIPLRAANLESRGFLTARPDSAIPLAWTGEPEPTLAGTVFYATLGVAAWGFLLCPWL